MVPETPLTVTVYVPGTTVALALMVSVEEPAPVIDVGLNANVTPVGAPLADNDTAELKPLRADVLKVVLVLVPCMRVAEVVESATEKPGGGAMVSTMDAVRTRPAEVPFTVSV